MAWAVALLLRPSLVRIVDASGALLLTYSFVELRGLLPALDDAAENAEPAESIDAAALRIAAAAAA